MTGTIKEPSSVATLRASAEDGLTTRVRGEYREMPGMRLTVDQAMRLWNVDRETCADVLSSLVAAQFLEQDRDGRFIRTHGGY